MYMVYWTIVEDGAATPAFAGIRYHRNDPGHGLHGRPAQAPARRRGLRFITMSSEHPDSVGHPGVDVTGPDYNWKKRRR